MHTFRSRQIERLPLTFALLLAVGLAGCQTATSREVNEVHADVNVIAASLRLVDAYADGDSDRADFPSYWWNRVGTHPDTIATIRKRGLTGGYQLTIRHAGTRDTLEVIVISGDTATQSPELRRYAWSFSEYQHMNRLVEVIQQSIALIGQKGPLKSRGGPDTCFHVDLESGTLIDVPFFGAMPYDYDGLAWASTGEYPLRHSRDGGPSLDACAVELMINHLDIVSAVPAASSE